VYFEAAPPDNYWEGIGARNYKPETRNLSLWLEAYSYIIKR